jgi:hypothetical protein
MAGEEKHSITFREGGFEVFSAFYPKQMSETLSTREPRERELGAKRASALEVQ